LGESSGGFIGLLNPEHLEKGDPKILEKKYKKGLIF
jgi:hypothetical protein